MKSTSLGVAVSKHHVKACPVCAAQLVERNYGPEHPSGSCVLSMILIETDDELAAWQDVGVRNTVLSLSGINPSGYAPSIEANEEVMRGHTIGVNEQRAIFSAMTTPR